MIRRRLVKSNRDSIARVVFPLRRLFGSPNKRWMPSTIWAARSPSPVKGSVPGSWLGGGASAASLALAAGKVESPPVVADFPGVPASRAGSYRLNLSDANDLRAHFPASNGPDGMGASGCVLVICLSVWISPQPEVAECTDAAQQR